MKALHQAAALVEERQLVLSHTLAEFKSRATLPTLVGLGLIVIVKLVIMQQRRSIKQG